MGVSGGRVQKNVKLKEHLAMVERAGRRGEGQIGRWNDGRNSCCGFRIVLLCRQVPGEMLKQVRYLYDLELKRLNHKAVQRAIREMQHKNLSSGGRRGHEVMGASLGRGWWAGC